LRKLVDAGVNAGLIVAPVLPGITDDLAHLDALFAAPARRRTLRFTPARYDSTPRCATASCRSSASISGAGVPLSARVCTSGGGTGEYANALSRRIEKLRRKHGFKNHTG